MSNRKGDGVNKEEEAFRIKERRALRKLYPSLPTIEISVYTAIWIIGVGYSIYNVYLASRHYYRFLAISDLEPGWFGPSKWRKDTTDYEWTTFGELIQFTIPFMIFQIAGETFFKMNGNCTFVVPFHYLLSTIYLVKIFGASTYVYLAFQPLFLFLVHLMGSSAVVWIAGISYVAFYNSWPLSELSTALVGRDDREKSYMVVVTMAWFNARCMSFVMDRHWNKAGRSGNVFVDFFRMLAFCQFIPLCCGGPLINYHEYEETALSDHKPWTSSKTKAVGLLLCRCLFWWFFGHLIQYGFYFNALQYHINIIEDLNLWTLCGIGYCMGQFFQLKYFVFYGFPILCLKTADYFAPSLPRCIGRVHVYSDMWRYFDNGLYRFMHRYIYVPASETAGKVVGSNSMLSRLVASAVCFTFVYVWHGRLEHVLIWSIMNFIGITCEGLAKSIGQHPRYVAVERKVFSPMGRRRFYAMLSAPLFQMSCLSNFFFFMGSQNGWWWIERSVFNFPVGTPTILFILYCGAQTSIEIKNWEIKRDLYGYQNLHLS